MLVLVAEIVVLVCPAVLVAILLKKRPPESIVCALLISDFIFSSIPVGNYFFFLGLPASSYLETIQWVKFTGPSFLSLWIVLTGYLIYRAIYYRSRNEWPPLFTFVLLPIVVSLIQNAVTYNSTYSETQKNVALVGIAGKDGIPSATSLMKYTNMRGNDFLILPEGFIVAKETEEDILPISTMLKRLSKRDSISILYGVMTSNTENRYTNAIRMVSPDNSERIHYKSYMIPFSEYLPLPGILGKSSFLQDHMLYPLLKRTSQDQTFIMPDSTRIAPLICYEALSPSHISDIVRLGADILFVSSSCTWINNRHFERISSKLIQIGALVTNHYIVRCAQDGISMFVDNKGRVYNSSENMTEYLEDTVSLNKKLPFYVKNKELIDSFYLCLLISMLILCFYKSN